MGTILKKFSLLALALVTVLTALAVSTKLLAQTIERVDYQVTTAFKNNGNDVTNKGSYGSSKFIITPLS